MLPQQSRWLATYDNLYLGNILQKLWIIEQLKRGKAKSKVWWLSSLVRIRGTGMYSVSVFLQLFLYFHAMHIYLHIFIHTHTQMISFPRSTVFRICSVGLPV